MALPLDPSPALHPLDHVLVAAVTVLLPVHDLLFWFPRLLKASPGAAGRARGRAYLESAAIEWVLTAAVLAWWAAAGRSFAWLGIRSPSGWGFWVAAGLAAAVVVVATWQRLSVTRSREADVRAAVLSQIEGLRPLLPHTRPELARFSLVSLTAGVCEETLFRGFVLWYLAALIPVIPALLVSSILFGFAHAYQGLKGVLQTAGVGAALVILYVLSGSLWVPMAVHAFVDLNSGLLAYAFLRAEPRPAEAAGE
jgi:membrane protease YdiL (CAAX protease family)